MGKRGPQPLDGEVKSSQLRMLLTDDERTELDNAAAAADKPTSTWARDELLRIARRKQRKPAGKK